MTARTRDPALRSPLSGMVRDLWAHREIVRNFVARSLKVKYHQSFLGYLWSLIEPLVYLAVFYFLYVILAGRPQRSYALSILLGVLTWRFFGSLVNDLTQVLVRNEGLIKRVYFPREVFLFSSLGFHLTSYGLSLLVAVPFLAYYRIAPTWRLAVLPAAVVLVALLAAGIGFVTSCLHARARDTGEMVSLAVRVGFWFSPAFYTIDRIPAEWLSLYLLNPMAVLLTLVRTSVTGQPSGIGAWHLAATALLSVGVFVTGAAIFRRLQTRAVKYL